MIGLLLTWIAGFEGIPIPYSPKLDDGITVLLLCCFFMSAYVLSRSRKFLVQLVKDFLLNRERTSIFAATTATDMRYMLLFYRLVCWLPSVLSTILLMSGRSWANASLLTFCSGHISHWLCFIFSGSG